MHRVPHLSLIPVAPMVISDLITRGQAADNWIPCENLPRAATVDGPAGLPGATSATVVANPGRTTASIEEACRNRGMQRIAKGSKSMKCS